MHFGLYAPIPMATVGSPEIAHSHANAQKPLPPKTRDLQFEHGLNLLMTADAVGFDLCLFAERHLGSDMHAWVLAGAMASRFENIRALVAIHPGLLDPVLTAKMAVTVDRMCKNGMALNVVNGWFDEEFKMFGGTMLQGDARYTRAKEFLAILQGLWRNESFSLDGEFYKIDNARLLLKPASKPPELYSVSASDQGRDFVAETCDWWFINYPKDAETTDDVLRAIEEGVADMRRRADSFGRKLRFALNPFIAIGRDADEAFEKTVARVLEFDPEKDERKLKRRMLPNMKAGCIGQPKDIQAQLGRFRDMGVELILCKFLPSVENARQIGEEIIQPFNGAKPAMAAQ